MVAALEPWGTFPLNICFIMFNAPLAPPFQASPFCTRSAQFRFYSLVCLVQLLCGSVYLFLCAIYILEEVLMSWQKACVGCIVHFRAIKVGTCLCTEELRDENNGLEVGKVYAMEILDLHNIQQEPHGLGPTLSVCVHPCPTIQSIPDQVVGMCRLCTP